MDKLLEIKDLHKKYGKKEVLKGFDLTVDKGKIIGLLGPNASGKSTLIKIINGLLTKDSGKVLVDGEEIGPASKAMISYLPEKTYISDWMKVSDILGYFKDMYQDFDFNKAVSMLTDFGIDLDAKVKNLSKGTKEKVQLSLVMSRNAKIYILDEPIAGVDPAARELILNNIIKNYPVDSCLIIVTHLITDIENICDEVVFVKDGRVYLHDNSDDLREKHQKSIDQLFREVYSC